MFVLSTDGFFDFEPFRADICVALLGDKLNILFWRFVFGRFVLPLFTQILSIYHTRLCLQNTYTGLPT